MSLCCFIPFTVILQWRARSGARLRAAALTIVERILLSLV
jgi:hypothetical protein